MKKIFFLKLPVLKICILIIIIAMLVNTERYINSAKEGLTVFCAAVLPALLPFFFFTLLLTKLGLVRDLGKPGRYIFAMSVMSGYPVGAKLISDLYRNNYLTKDECKHISSFSSVSGPMFILGTVGTVMLHDKTAGIIILLSHYFSAVLNGFFYKAKTKNYIIPPDKPIDNILGESIYSAVISVLIVGAYICIFYIIADVMLDLGIINLLAAPISLFTSPEAAGGIAQGLIEMTRGCLALSKSGTNINIIIPAITAIITFGGLSITVQSITILKETGITVPFYLKTKLTQTIIAIILAVMFNLIYISYF